MLLGIGAPDHLGVGGDGSEEIHELDVWFVARADVGVKHQVNDVIVATGLGLGRKEAGFGLPVDGQAVENQVFFENLKKWRE